MTGRSPGRRGAAMVDALRSPILRRVLVAYFFFSMTEWGTWIALLVWAYPRWGVTGTSIFAVCQLVPPALLTASVTAALARRGLMAGLRSAYAAQAVGFLTLGTLVLLDASALVVTPVAVMATFTISLTRPAHHALVPVVSRTAQEVTAGNSASGFLEASGIFVGPAASAALTALAGPGLAVATFGGLMGVAFLLTRLRVADLDDPRVIAATEASTIDRALRVVLRDPSARLLALLVASVSALVGMLDILLVVLAFDLLDAGEATLGVLNSAAGLGGLLGAAATVLLIGRRRLAPVLVVSAPAAGAFVALAGTAPALAVAMLLVGGYGAAKAFFDVTVRTFSQRQLPDRLLAAMFGLQEALMMTGFALGTTAAPLLVAALGPRGAFVAGGALLPVATLLGLRALRRLDAATQVPEDALARLNGVPFLQLLTPRVLDRLAIESRRLSAAAGAVPVREGTPGELFYVIESGRVEVSIDGERVRELGVGDWFGELALLRASPRTATVTALRDTELWTLERDSFLTAVRAGAEVTGALDAHARTTYRD